MRLAQIIVKHPVIDEPIYPLILLYSYPYQTQNSVVHPSLVTAALNILSAADLEPTLVSCWLYTAAYLLAGLIALKNMGTKYSRRIYGKISPQLAVKTESVLTCMFARQTGLTCPNLHALSWSHFCEPSHLWIIPSIDLYVSVISPATGSTHSHSVLIPTQTGLDSMNFSCFVQLQHTGTPA